MVIFICSCHRPNVQVGFWPSFFWMKIDQSIPLQSQVGIQDEHNSFWFTLLKSCSTKCKAFTMLVFTKYQRMYFHTLTEKQPTSIFHAYLIMMTYTIQESVAQLKCFVADLLGSHYDPISCLCEQCFWV